MSEAIDMSVSGVFKKDGKKTISVLFTDGDRTAEGTIPDAKILTNNGFTEEEIYALEEYLRSEQSVIKKLAREVNIMNAFLGKGRKK